MNIFPIATEITPDVLHGAMDEHARRIAIAFAEWINKEEHGEMYNNGKHLVGDDNYAWYYSTPERQGIREEFIGSTNDLFDLFIKQLLKK